MCLLQVSSNFAASHKSFSTLTAITPPSENPSVDQVNFPSLKIPFCLKVVPHSSDLNNNFVKFQTHVRSNKFVVSNVESHSPQTVLLK